MIAPVVILAALITLGAISIWRWQVDAKGDPGHLLVSGTVEGEEVAVGSKVGGRLLAVHVKEGDALMPGTLVAEFDVPELYNQKQQLIASMQEAEASKTRLVTGARPQEIAQARAQCDAARAQLAELEQGTRGEDLAAAEAAWRAAEVDYNLAQQDLDRAQQLFAAGVIPRSQIDAAQARADGKRQAADMAHEMYLKAQAGPRQTQIEALRAQLRAAQAVLDLLLAGSRSEDIAAAQARLERVGAQIAGLEISVAESKVFAPSAGSVLTLNYRPGDLVPQGAAVIDILQTGSYFVQVFIPENKLSWVAPGTPSQLSVDAYPGVAFSGKVTFLATQGEFTPRNLQTKEKRVEEVFRCKVQVDDPSGRLRPGMVCDVMFARPDAVAAR
jgi:HlyD family secretion protein